MNPQLKIKENETYFVEKYGYWQGYGYGVMLSALKQANIQYVMFYIPNNWKKIVVNQSLLDLYNKTE